jgi:hypothetical protein
MFWFITPMYPIGTRVSMVLFPFLEKSVATFLIKLSSIIIELNTNVTLNWEAIWPNLFIQFKNKYI